MKKKKAKIKLLPKSLEGVKCARKCSVTGKGMNEGWICEQNLMYFKYKKDAIAYVKKRGYKNLQAAYDDEFIYWTDWEVPADAQYIVKNGKLVELEPEEPVSLIHDVLKFGDIDVSMVPKGLERKIRHLATYDDIELEDEHLYSMEKVFDQQLEKQFLTKKENEFIVQLKIEMNKKDLAYFRIVKR